MKKIDEFKNFVKDHKKEIVNGAIGVGVTVGGIALLVSTKKTLKFPETSFKGMSISKWEEIEKARIDKLNWNLGTMTSLWDEGGCLNTIVTDLTVSDLGKLGDELLKIDGVTKQTGVDIIAGLGTK